MHQRLPEPNGERSDVTTAEDGWAVQDTVQEHAWLLDAMLHRFPNGSINVFDRDLRYLFAAGMGLQRAGLSSAQLVGKRLVDLFEPAAVAYVRPFYERAFAGEEIVFDLAVFGRAYSVRASPLRAPGGTISAIVAVVQEVTAGPSVEGVLTRRQQEVAVCVPEGLSNQELAERLTITEGTAANHVEQILTKLDLKNRTQLAVWAVERGLYRSGRDDEGL